jgi:hypothetical protein
VDIDSVDGTDVHKVAQPVQSWTNQGGTTVAIIDKLSLDRHRMPSLLARSLSAAI